MGVPPVQVGMATDQAVRMMTISQIVGAKVVDTIIILIHMDYRHY